MSLAICACDGTYVDFEVGRLRNEDSSDGCLEMATLLEGPFSTSKFSDMLDWPIIFQPVQILVHFNCTSLDKPRDFPSVVIQAGLSTT